MMQKKAGGMESMKIACIVIGTVIISVAASIITVRWIVGREIDYLNQMYRERTDYMLKRSEEIVLDVLRTTVRKFQ